MELVLKSGKATLNAELTRIPYYTITAFFSPGSGGPFSGVSLVRKKILWHPG